MSELFEAAWLASGGDPAALTRSPRHALIRNKRAVGRRHIDLADVEQLVQIRRETKLR